ncbi:putative kinase domain protein [Blattamonas nauphoetae]|uniref:Kinase domain protein n=1 Tax=Blattamonas nauphoetae TaxID=2049346 RepID=A0ABQ9YLF1_9EUKA|nr:putative kinase domain protein [Blattamonas nauphoetae]
MDTRARYGDPEFWEAYYTDKTIPFDWYITFDRFQELFFEHFPSGDENILECGCGTSDLAIKLRGYDYPNVKCIDVSQNAITIAQQQCIVNSLHVDIECFDALNLSQEEGAQYDVVIDKGLLDCFFCADDSYHKIHRYLTGVSHVLKPGGKFVLITSGGKQDRKCFVLKPEYKWELDAEETIALPIVRERAPLYQPGMKCCHLFIIQKSS